MRVRVRWLMMPVLGALLVLGVRGGQAQQPPHAHPPARDTHAPHGTPPGWKFTWPKGDPATGREVFAKLECWSCHEVQGATFPRPKDAAPIGRELSQMGPLHEPEFFAEAIINPSAVIDDTRYAGPDGSSKMPSFNDSMTVQEAIDLVAYLRSLKPPSTSGPAADHGAHGSQGGNHGKR